MAEHNHFLSVNLPEFWKSIKKTQISETKTDILSPQLKDFLYTTNF